MDMSKYKGMFLTEAREHLGNMNQLVVALEKEPRDKGNIDSLFRAAHSVKGMAASMGYEGIAELSHKMEDLMDRFRKEEMSITPEATDVLLEGIDALERLVNAVEQDIAADVDVPGLVEKIKSFGTQKSGAAATQEQPAIVSPEPQTPSPEHRPQAAGFNITIEISKDSPVPAARAFLICRKLKELGEVTSINPSEAEIKAGKFSGQLKAGLVTEAERDRIEEVVRGMGDVASVALEPLSSMAQHAAPLQPETQAQKPEVPAAAPAKEREHELPKVVKVNTSLLDYFVNAIGELIINKSRLHEISRGIPSKELRDGLNQLDRLVRDLHHQVMSVRMMPIESILERFPRIVRDLARRQGKEVDLEIEGQDIELDRSILEGLGNPLTHMVRNSIDHGIEAPDERRRLCKPLPARIFIKASREKDQVFIDVIDDGRGMDPEMLKEAAVKKGLITGGQASEMDGKEALLLICLPGFSTAKEVSDISGRGVGMDAVKSVVEPLGGSIDIDSRPGEGTKITLRLPLTVAIIQSLIIEAASEVYAIPISRVLKTLEVEKGDVKVSQKQRLIDFGGYLIPLLSLRKMLRLPPAPVQEGFMPVVVTEIKGKIVGLVVDRFLGQQETFIKPLGRPLSKIAGLSGTTVLGNGKTVFLLDVGNLI